MLISYNLAGGAHMCLQDLSAGTLKPMWLPHHLLHGKVTSNSKICALCRWH